jgi:Kef-type K+ transport system membrane component KefB
MLEAPHGPAWFFLLIVAVVVFGPYLANRVGLPSLIGLIVGGFVIGAHGLGILPSEEGLDALGEIGLLYLMFMAGVELDLGTFATYRRAAITFGLLTFSFPFFLGIGSALWLGYTVLAAILIGSLWASHTLVTYPAAVRAGLTAHPAVATAVGGTVITDTLSLTVLALVAAVAVGEGSISAQAVAIGIGLVVVVAFGLVVLPRLGRWFNAGIGQEVGLRFLFVFGAFLAAATLAGMVGIEGIIGAFFAGLGLNRLVPNRGPLMDRVEFFGTAFFIPIFLVSVGLLVVPEAIFDISTLATAAVFLAVVLAGKGLAALVTGRLFAFKGGEVGLVFSLTIPQAAATLAAATVGLEVGLIDEATMNAVIVVIVGSLLVASFTTNRFAARVSPVTRREYRPGEAVVVAIEEPALARRLADVARVVAEADGGVIIPVHVAVSGSTPAELADARQKSREIDEAVRGSGIETDPSLRVAASVPVGIRDAIVQNSGSLLVIARRRRLGAGDVLLTGVADQMVRDAACPVVILNLADARAERILYALEQGDLTSSRQQDVRLALDLVAHFAKTGREVVVAAAEPEAVRPLIDFEGTVEKLTTGRWEWIEAAAQPGDIVLLTPGYGPWALTLSSTRLADREGVSAAVVVAAYRGATEEGPLAGSGAALANPAG